MTHPFEAIRKETVSSSDASRQAAELNATVPYELGTEADPQFRVAAAFDELSHAI